LIKGTKRRSFYVRKSCGSLESKGKKVEGKGKKSFRELKRTGSENTQLGKEERTISRSCR